MGHAICAVLLKGPFDAQLAERYDLFGIALAPEITMFHIDHYYTACWQKQLNVQGNLEGVVDCAMFPSEAIVHILMAKVSGTLQPVFAVILTDYFGGVGQQWAQVYQGAAIVNPQIRSINQALAQLGVVARPGMDEFDTVGLSNYRSQPEYLEQYRDLADTLGV